MRSRAEAVDDWGVSAESSRDPRHRSIARTAPQTVDALLLVSFGGPEGPEDVMPFLRNVTRGRDISDARLAEVAAHYDAFGGRSPINGQNRELLAKLAADLAPLPVYWGNRNWAPCLTRALAPVVEKLADEFEGKVKVGKLDIDESPGISAKYGIRSVPTVLVFEAGQKKGQHVGLTNRDKLVALLGV
jgi:hypothetical protein